MLQSGGLVTATAGTPVRLTNNEGDPTAQLMVRSFMAQAHLSNTGNVYIGTASLNKTTLAGVYGIIPIPTTNIIPSFGASITFHPGPVDLNDIYLDVDTTGEGVIISFIPA